MMPDTDPIVSRGLPSSSAPRVGKVRTLVGLLGAPVAWLIQMSVSEPLAAYACYPKQTLLTAPLWSSLMLILAIINIVCLICAIVSALIAWSTWRRIRREASDQGIFSAASGEGEGQFLPLLGVIASQLFVVAIIFTGFAIVLVAPCSSWF